jgi:hypothetical protein
MKKKIKEIWEKLLKLGYRAYSEPKEIVFAEICKCEQNIKWQEAFMNVEIM